ncbi:hypothetical protein V1264_006823 [Littorina saxatilis]|uniref:Uncharacterized protein n=2 Tax=Littorina saxatilis TaxID=31220 RepID=A0AAN9AY89_9CAEN
MQCLNQNGDPVDWFIVYKMPKLRHEKETEFGEGVAQYYMDGQTPSWTLSPQPINATTGHAVYHTLQQIYKAQKDSIFYLMFNDEKPSGSKSLSHGHTKGVLGFDNKSGFWLIHSAPQFPPEQKDGYQWASNACDFGQSFLCVSFAYKSLGILAEQLLFYYPYVYDYNLPKATLADFPRLADLVNSTRIEKPPYFSIRQDLFSLAGMPLINFAKFTYFGADLYDALVSPTLNASLLVESWQNGIGRLGNNCSVGVYNIYEVILPGDHFFKESKDHSKYAVSLSPAGWVCVGGINRESTQFKRGGGTMCFQNQDVWKSYMNMITFFHSCPEEKH